MSKWFRGELVESIQKTAEIKSLTFKIPGFSKFKSGQYSEIRPVANGGSRKFSIVSSPDKKDQLEFGIQLLKGGEVSPKLFNLKVGDFVQISRPLGKFYINYKKYNPVVLIAGGSGVTPFISMLRYISKHPVNRQLVLVISAETKDDIPYSSEINSFKKRIKNLQVIKTFTGKKSTEGRNGRIDIKLLSEILEEFSNSYFFISGSTSFVDGIWSMLIKLKVPLNHINRERFGPYIY
ncbi:FAD-dependent oxidoreductase [Candidatus Daviesbacteria bacterium]|nr:FAD-dependent oxidoreductase [Candidatus Daviesbacteria bacterium]